ncbi:copper chaperone PCu(A)C [Roseovarius autotrophicus]|uniref:copper chaperone PCu(A)C n=1 Tax=Roseovarius autotrophicus TaxID=2824121 RepID=UPI001B397D56|nr:copper chaperone PCu(A)C [Roseovarius autotrophicus]
MSLKFTIAVACGLAFSTPVLAQHVEVHDAYARAASAASGAAFFTLHNHGDKADHLIGAKSPAAQKVELHTHREDGSGVMRMIHVEEGFPLPAHGTINFERGGNHVMFIGLTHSFEHGASVPLTLIFEKSGEVTLEVPVDMERKAGDHAKSN